MNSGEDHEVKHWRPSWLSIFGALLGFGFLFLFLPAGRINWREGWIFWIVLTALTTLAVIYLERVNPEIFEARRKIHKGTKLWDKIVLGFLLPISMAIYPVAALDSGRYQWSMLSWILIALGFVFIVAGFVLLTWAQGVNRFFEPGVRIQKERSHHVVETGPYAYVRHPGYVGAFLFFSGSALSLGSLWALMPAGLSILLLILRTVLEDNTLQRELPGYPEYCRKVPYRLIPGVW